MKRILFIVLVCCSMQVHAQPARQRLDTLLSYEQECRKAGMPLTSYLFVEIGEAYLQMSNYTNAFEYISRALYIAEENGDANMMARCYQHMGSISFYQRNYARSDSYNAKAMDVFRKKGETDDMARLFKRMADNRTQLRDSAMALRYYDSALHASRGTEDMELLASIYANKSILYNTDYYRKIMMALRAKSIFDSVHSSSNRDIVNTGNIGVAYLDIVRYGRPPTLGGSDLIPLDRASLLLRAETYIREAIAKAHSINDPDNASYFTGVLAELQESRGDYKGAYQNIRKYYDVQDSIYSQANKNKIAELEGERAVAELGKAIAVKNLELSAATRWRLALFSGVLFLLLIGLLLVRQNRLRKKANARLVQVNQKLDEANRVKARFFAILSHDLRSPISNLVNFLHLQQTSPDLLSEAAAAAHRRRIASAAESLLNNMESLLIWSKDQMERFAPVMQHVRIIDLLKTAEERFRDEPRIVFGSELPAATTVRTDVNYIQTIIQNLTTNALTAVETMERPRIEWLATSVDGQVLLSISDNGPGVPEQELKALLDESAQPNGQHGFGMYIIRDLSKAIGCRLEVDVERGTRFRIYFPA